MQDVSKVWDILHLTSEGIIRIDVYEDHEDCLCLLIAASSQTPEVEVGATCKIENNIWNAQSKLLRTNGTHHIKL